ncbi:MAG: hypothetical protein FJ265_04240 [Planctomycetes bacterium]|nr:hypothetical protein [Planctomycetota bacterium]
MPRLSPAPPRLPFTAFAALAAFAALTAVCPAQFVNRAVWLGDDTESVRRDFRQGTEYFLDRFAYVVAPPWWDPRLERFADRFDYRFGSTSTTQFTIEGALDLGRELGDGFGFRYHFLQGEHRDARFLRHAIDLEYALAAETAVFAQIEPFADKSQIDVSLGAWFLRRGDSALRVMLTAVDWSNDKSRTADYGQDPYGVQLAGAFGDPGALRIAFDLAGQLPFSVRRRGDGGRFAMQRWIGSVQAQWCVDRDDRVLAAVESEWTDKELRAGPGGADEDFDRTFHQVLLEWWRDGGSPWSAGLLHTFHDEDGVRPADPAQDLRTRRREWFAIGRLHVPARGKLSFEPQVFAGWVQDRYRDGSEDRDRERFEGKVAWNARWDFSPRAWLVLVVTTQLDELAFGGGGAQFVARF